MVNRNRYLPGKTKQIKNDTYNMIYNTYIHKVLECKKIMMMDIGYFFLFALKNKKIQQTNKKASFMRGK